MALNNLSHLRRNYHIKHVTTNYIMIDGELFQKGGDGALLQCLQIDKALHVIVEVHYGLCRLHQRGVKMA